jgi:hypothetical protein
LLLPWQLFCPYADNTHFLMYKVTTGRDLDSWANSHLSNFGLATAVTADLSSCPILTSVSPTCLFVNASSLPIVKNGADGGFRLMVGFTATDIAASVDVYFLDEPLEKLCAGSKEDLWAAVGKSTGIAASYAPSAWNKGLYEVTRLDLQLTRWEDDNVYTALALLPSIDTTSAPFDGPDAENVYPVLAPGEVGKKRPDWAKAAYRNRTAWALIDEYSKDNGTNSWYFDVDVRKSYDVVTYLENNTDDYVFTLGVYGAWGGGPWCAEGSGA